MVQIIDVNKLKLQYKIWYEDPEDGQSLLGEQKIQLLIALQETGSIRAAAENCDLEYKLAWEMLQSIKEKFGSYEIIISVRGSGGGSRLTTLGIDLIEKYLRMTRVLDEVIQGLEKGKQIVIRGRE